jgi:hypothetical protein
MALRKDNPLPRFLASKMMMRIIKATGHLNVCFTSTFWFLSPSPSLPDTFLRRLRTAVLLQTVSTGPLRLSQETAAYVGRLDTQHHNAQFYLLVSSSAVRAFVADTCQKIRWHPRPPRVEVCRPYFIPSISDIRLGPRPLSIG